MIDSANLNASQLPDPAADWVDAMLARDADEHRGDYIADDGFTARFMQALPRVGVLPAWRRPAVITLWAIAAVLVVVALPALAHEVARAAYTLFAARPFALSTLALLVAAVGIASWTAAAVTLRRD